MSSPLFLPLKKPEMRSLPFFFDRPRVESSIPGLDDKMCCVFAIKHTKDFYDQSIGNAIGPLLTQISKAISPEAKVVELALRVFQPMPSVPSDSIYQCHIEGLKEIHLLVSGGRQSTLTLVFSSEKARQGVADAFDGMFAERCIRCTPKKDLTMVILPEECDEKLCYVLELDRWKEGIDALFGNQIEAILRRIGKKVSPNADPQQLPLQVSLLRF